MKEERKAFMEAYQDRVVKEKEDLDNKICSLFRFIGSGTFNGLSDEEKRRLKRQKISMEGYSDVLAERIQTFC